MEEYIRNIIPTLYPFINESNTPYLSHEDLRSKNMLMTNCGINSEILFDLLKQHDLDDGSVTYSTKIADLNFDTTLIYKIYNVWKEGHSHVATFYFYEGSWSFVESNEVRNTMFIRKMTKTQLEAFLTEREQISFWQEICSLPARIYKVNVVINKSQWIASHTK